MKRTAMVAHGARLGRLLLLAFGAGLLALPGTVEAQTIRYVSVSDPTCGGRSPCYTTIQAAINAAQAGDTVRIQPGTYIEQLNITGKNFGATSETRRIVIEIDLSAPVGSVLLSPPTTQCTNGHAVRFQQSKFITLRGLTITGAGGQAVSLLGGNNDNDAIHLDRLRIFGNGSSECNGGITIARGNPDTLIANSLIYANGRNGITFIDAHGGPHYLVGNTIHGNAWNGLDVAREHVVWLVNTAITGNGTATGSTGGRVGVKREGSPNRQPAGIRLLNNLVCGNRLGELNGPILDPTDAGNRTPTGSEGSGVTASPGCDLPSNVYANLAGPDGNAHTNDDDFTPVTASPLLDAGVDPRTLGFNPSLNPVFESDYLMPAARPRLGTPGGTAAFDIGAREPNVADEIGPLVTIIAPPEGRHVRGAVPIEAQATDQGSGVAAFTLRIGTQPLAATLTPSLPPPASSVTATTIWNTTAFTDGIYTLTAGAGDAAGNDGMATRLLVADNTPPETFIDAGPSGQIFVGNATFSFSGSDNQTAGPSLVFSWRLDSGPWSPFSADTSANLSGLAESPHVFAVKARDLAGNEDASPASRAFTVGPALTVTITEPGDGAAVPAGPIVIRGTVQAGGAEVTVMVNGVPAAVVGTTFLVLADIAASVTTVKATAQTAAGQQTSHSIIVSVSGTPTPAAIALRPFPEVGRVPLVVTFALFPTPASGSVIQLDLDGNGTVDFTGATLEGQAFTYAAPGIYLPAVTVVDAQGGRTTARALVQVLDGAALDTLLRAKWQTMKDALRAGDIARAVTQIVLRAQEGYAAAFQTIAAQLPGVDNILADITPGEVRNRAAIYRMLRLDGGVTKSFEVRFVIDGDGVWRIQGF